MKNRKIDVKAGMLFPLPFIILGSVFIFAATLLFIDHPIIAGMLFVLGFLIVTAYEGTQVDPSARTYREYNSFLFLKTGKQVKYLTIEGIFIHKAKVSQKMFTPRTLNSSTFTHTEYNAYLKINGEQKIFLMSDRSKPKLLDKANAIAKLLNTAVADHAIMR